MIDISSLNFTDIGKWVVYRSFNDVEKGRIKSWNDKWVFVVYNCSGNWEHFLDYTSQATNPEDLFE